MVLSNHNIMNTINQYDILLNHSLIEVPVAKNQLQAESNVQQLVGTIISNLLYYGYVPSQQTYEAIEQLAETTPATLDKWWQQLEMSLKKAKGADKDIGKYIVYLLGGKPSQCKASTCKS
jgi:Leucine-rich repeat (LRR) protein